MASPGGFSLASNKDSLIETIGVIIGLAGLTCLLVGTIAFPVAGSWKNSVSIATLPIGAIFLIGSAFIKPRLPAVLLLPAGIVGVSIGLLGMNKLPENTSAMPYWIPVIAGCVFIVASIIFNISALSRSASKRRGLVGANVFLLCLMGLAVLVGINYMASMYYSKRDLTKTGRFTLAPRTIDILKNLPEPVEVTFVMQPGDFVSDFAKNMIEDYATLAKNKLTVKYIDPVNEPEQALKFFKDLSGGDKVYSVIFRTTHAFKQVPQSQLLEEVNPMAAYYGQQEDPKFKGEAEFTAAIIKVTDVKKSTIYFTTGKGELPIDSEAAGGNPSAMTAVSKYIKDDNYDTKTINIASDKRIPDDCDVLAIIGPKRPFSQWEIDLISEYLKNRGKLFVALEPVIDRDVQSSGLEKLLEDWGIRVRTDVLAINVERTIFGVTGGAEIFAEHPKHEITQKMGSMATLFRIACIVDPIQPPRGPEGQPAPARWDAASLAKTSEQGWGEADLDNLNKIKFNEGADVRGPVSLAAASQERDPNMPPPNPYGPPPKPDPNFNGARIVVVGDSDFLTDPIVRNGPGNVDFTRNCFNWLARKNVSLSISAKPLLAEAISIKPEEMQAIFYSTLVGLPYLALMIGGIVYWRRSK